MPASHALIEGGMTKLVICRALLRILERLIGLVEVLETLLSLLVTGIAIRMTFLGELAESGFEILLGRGARHIEDFIVVAFCHGRAFYPASRDGKQALSRQTIREPLDLSRPQ